MSFSSAFKNNILMISIVLTFFILIENPKEMTSSGINSLPSLSFYLNTDISKLKAMNKINRDFTRS